MREGQPARGETTIIKSLPATVPCLWLKSPPCHVQRPCTILSKGTGDSRNVVKVGTHWPTDLLWTGLHAAQSTSLEYPGTASLGAHALKLLTFPNLLFSLLIVMKYWTPILRNSLVDLDLSAFLLSKCHLLHCSKWGMQKLAYMWVMEEKRLQCSLCSLAEHGLFMLTLQKKFWDLSDRIYCTHTYGTNMCTQSVCTYN